MPYTKIAIVGASGTVGKIVLDGLLKSSKFNITVLSREGSTAKFPAAVTVIRSDFSNASLDAAFHGQDAIISTVGAAGFEEQKKLVDSAVRAGVGRFIPSEFSSSSQDAAIVELLPLFGQKAALIEYLKTKESTAFTWTAIACSGLFDWGLTSGFLDFDIPNRAATIWDDGNKRVSVTNEKELVDALIAVLTQPDKTANQFLHISSLETTQQEILAELQEATGSTWSVKEISTDEQVREGREKLGAGDFSGALNLVKATLYGDIAGLKADYAKAGLLANSLLGLGTDSVKATVKRVVQN